MPLSPSEALDEIVKQQNKIVAREVINLHSELVAVAPVDSGNFKASWEAPKKTIDGWLITNTTLYASILWDGRRFVAGKWLGSEQWQSGGAPILAKYNNRIEQAFKRIKV